MTQEAMKQALDALEKNYKLINGEGTRFGLEGAMDGYYSGCFDVDGTNKETENAIASLRQAIAELESQEPVGFAGIEMWIGNTRIKKLMTQTELHFAIDPWAIVKFNSDSCIDALKEKNT